MIDSLYSQTYDNFHHWITYEDNHSLEILKSLVNVNKTTFIRVPKYKQMKNLWMYYQYHDVYTNYLDSDWTENCKMKILIGDKPDRNEIDSLDNEVVEKIFNYEKNGFWCSTIGETRTNICQHFPFNLYLKIAETHIKDGWILYLDDDDLLEDKNSLLKLKNQISNTDEDTLQVFRFRNRNKEELIPHNDYLTFMKTGHPIIHMEVIAGCFCFHSKYREFTVWDEWRRGDVRTVKALERVIPKINYIDDVILKAGERQKIYA
jgi:hypothetical protein